MKSNTNKSGGFLLLDVLIGWVLPIIGGILTLLLLRHLGLRSAWWYCLALPGAFVFQLAILLSFLGFVRLLDQKRKPDGSQ
jgi:hypothetical protein